MTNPKHSPLPWEADGTIIASIDGTCIRYIGDLSQIERTTDECEADAKFIVRAVNSHEELLSCAKQTLAEFETSGGPALLWENLKEVVAKAEGRTE